MSSLSESSLSSEEDVQIKKPSVPPIATTLVKPSTSPLMSPLSPSAKALQSFQLAASDLKGVSLDEFGSPDIDGIPEEQWDIAFEDLEIEREVAEGTFGRVFVASYFGTKVAVKLLFQVDVVENIGKYVLRELSMLRAVTHPNVVQFIGLCKHNEDVYVVTEFLARGDLMEIVYDTDNSPLSWSLIIYLMLEMTKPVAFLHSRRIVHRDLKLENVLVDENWKVKLCDFGFARCVDGVETRQIGGSRARAMTVAGTDQWMAPEILLQQPYNEYADVFSLGCTFYELLCRKQPPFRSFASRYAFDVQEFLQNVSKTAPSELVKLVLDMCQLNPLQRPTAKQVMDRLQEIGTSFPPADLTEKLTVARASSERSSTPSKSVSEIVAESPVQGSPDPEDHDPSDARSLSPSLRRCFSVDDLIKTDDVRNSNVEIPLSLCVRYHSVMLKKVGNILEATWLSVTSSVRNKWSKYYAALTNDPSMYFWKSDKSAEISSFRIVLDVCSVISRTDKSDTLRVSSPVHPGVFWHLQFKSPETADSWFSLLCQASARSDIDYQARLRSGFAFGWTPVTRDPSGTIMRSCFVAMMGEREVVLAINSNMVRVVVPFTEEILLEWRFATVASYALSADEHKVRISINNLGSEPSIFGKSRMTLKRLEFVSPSQCNAIYEALEEAWRACKEAHDRIYSELLERTPLSPKLVASADKKGNRRSLTINLAGKFSRTGSMGNLLKSQPDSPKSPQGGLSPKVKEGSPRSPAIFRKGSRSSMLGKSDGAISPLTLSPKTQKKSSISVSSENVK